MSSCRVTKANPDDGDLRDLLTPHVGKVIVAEVKS